MEAFLQAWLGRVLPEDCTLGVHPDPGKDALLRRLGDRLGAYAKWITCELRIVVVVDRDRDESEELKSKLERICESAGLRSRRAAGSPDWQVVTRIAIEELEAWYFGDWHAVCQPYPRVPANVPSLARYREPDAIAGGTWEAFERVLQKSGYFRQGLAKVQAATEIGRYVDPACSRPGSFAALRDAVTEATA